MGSRDMYAYAIQTAKGKFQGNAEERDGKLYFKGSVATEAEGEERDLERHQDDSHVAEGCRGRYPGYRRSRCSQGAKQSLLRPIP